MVCNTRRNIAVYRNSWFNHSEEISTTYTSNAFNTRERNTNGIRCGFHIFCCFYLDMFAVCIEINTVEIKYSLTHTSMRLMPNASERAVRKRDWTVEICRRSDSVYRWKLWLWDVSLKALNSRSAKNKNPLCIVC